MPFAFAGLIIGLISRSIQSRRQMTPIQRFIRDNLPSGTTIKVAAPPRPGKIAAAGTAAAIGGGIILAKTRHHGDFGPERPENGAAQGRFDRSEPTHTHWTHAGRGLLTPTR
jgi:hypothetical protein